LSIPGGVTEKKAKNYTFNEPKSNKSFEKPK